MLLVSHGRPPRAQVAGQLPGPQQPSNAAAPLDANPANSPAGVPHRSWSEPWKLCVPWLALLINDPETAERVLFFPAIAMAFISSAFAPVADLAGWMQPVARANPVTAAAAVIRSLASSGPVAAPLLELGCWTAALVLIPGFLAARRWNAPR